MTRRQFMGARLTEQPDGSAVLVVRTQGRYTKAYEIHLAPHVYQDIGFEFYRQFSHNQSGQRHREDE